MQIHLLPVRFQLEIQFNTVFARPQIDHSCTEDEACYYNYDSDSELGYYNVDLICYSNR